MSANGPTGDLGQASNSIPQSLDVLAELELVRRRSELFERRLASWEAGLLELRQRLHALETRRDPDAPAWLDALGDVRHRLDRLERRRRAVDPTAPSRPPSVEPPPPPPMPSPTTTDDDSVAVVRARWDIDHARAGDTIALRAFVDGIPAGTTLAVAIRTVHASPVVASVAARCDGDRIEATWTIPDGLGPTELIFEIEHRGVRTRSNTLVVE